MILVTSEPLSTERAVREAATPGSGCVATYVGLIRETSRGKPVRSVTYVDADGTAARRLQDIAGETAKQYPVENVVIHHRTGTLNVGDCNLVVAVASAHRAGGLAAAAYIVDCFKERLPTSKTETYTDGSRYPEA